MKESFDQYYGEAFMGRSLLLIAYKFPPMQSISCNRTWALFEGLRRYFDHVYVITTSNRHILPRDPVETPDSFVFDAKTIDYRTLFQSADKTSVAGEQLKVSMTGKLIAKLQSSLPTLRVFGEGSFLYIHNAIRIGSGLIRSHRITHVLSTFPPFADHLIAAGLKKRFPELYWIADFRDLHVDPTQRNLFFRRYQLSRNRQILSGANMITTVSEGLAVHLSKVHPHVQVLRNGIRSIEPADNVSYEKFTIAYTGSMFQDKRRPETLLQALSELIDSGEVDKDRIQLIYAGKDSAVWSPLIREFGLESIFSDAGLVGKPQAVEIQRRSHMNVLLTYSTQDLKGNMTGKLYDYLSAGRPILVIINGSVDDELESTIAEAEAGDVVYHGDIESAREIILQMYRHWRDNTALPKMNLRSLRKMSWSFLLDEFAQANGWSQRQVSEDSVNSAGYQH